MEVLINAFAKAQRTGVHWTYYTASLALKGPFRSMKTVQRFFRVRSAKTHNSLAPLGLKWVLDAPLTKKI